MKTETVYPRLLSICFSLLWCPRCIPLYFSLIYYLIRSHLPHLPVFLHCTHTQAPSLTYTLIALCAHSFTHLHTHTHTHTHTPEEEEGEEEEEEEAAYVGHCWGPGGGACEVHQKYSTRPS